MKKKNPAFAFFASVKLALLTLFLLATTSIIGTIIPQKESYEWYVQNYSKSTADLFQVLSIPDMYNSWWFLGLLTILSLNLIICSIDRFPGVWKQVTADNLATKLTRIQKMRLSRQWNSGQSKSETASALTQDLDNNGWKIDQRERENTILLFAQKGAMSRTGVYIVHASILVIFLGAIIGEITGFKGSVMLPETRSTDSIFTFDTHESINLGFEVRCNRFDIEFYDSGMPKAYKSHLTVLENGKHILNKEIVVNDPLTYKGITFYQSSYQSYEDFLLTITEKESNLSETVVLPFQQQQALRTNKNIRLGIINAEAMGQSITRMKVWFDDGQGPASTFWLNAGTQATVERPGKNYTVAGKQMYATGLQVAKDPGVWVVYIGCGLMILGLFVAFFMSHRRIWLLISKENDTTSVLFTGSANKNKNGFETTFNALAEKIAPKTASSTGDER